MKHILRKSGQSGFTIIELIVALGIFLVICGAAFALLGSSQKRFQSDSQLLNSFQEARLGMDQMVRDVNDAGFPPPSSFVTANSANANFFASTPFAWSPGYATSTPCAVSVGNNCTSPNEFDLIVETNITPHIPNSPVYWVRYQLDTSTNTLKRGAIPKVAGDDPVSDFNTANNMVPYVQNVMNNASAAQIAQFQASYPKIFPAGNPVPIFTYTCDTSTGPRPCSVAANHTPQNIRSVSITLIVMAALPDAQSGQVRLVELNGLARRINPNQ